MHLAAHRPGPPQVGVPQDGRPQPPRAACPLPRPRSRALRPPAGARSGRASRPSHPRSRSGRRGPRRSRGRSPGRARRRCRCGRASSPPRKNGSKTRSRSPASIPRRCRRPRSRRSRSPRSARTVTLPSAGVWRIAFWIRLNSTRWSFSGLPRAGAASAARLGAHRDALGLGLRAHRVDGLVDELVERRRARSSSARRRPRSRDSSKRSSISAPSAVTWVVIWREVAAARRLVDDVVVDRLGEQLQRGDRRAQVVRDGRDEAALRRARLARGCRGARPWRRRRRQLGELVARRWSRRRASRAPSPTASSVARSRVDVGHDAARDERRAVHGRDEPGEDARATTQHDASCVETNISTATSDDGDATAAATTTVDRRELAPQAAERARGAPRAARPARSPRAPVAASSANVTTPSPSAVADADGRGERAQPTREQERGASTALTAGTGSRRPRRSGGARLRRGRARSSPAAGGCGP